MVSECEQNLILERASSPVFAATPLKKDSLSVLCDLYACRLFLITQPGNRMRSLSTRSKTCQPRRSPAAVATAKVQARQSQAQCAAKRAEPFVPAKAGRAEKSKAGSRRLPSVSLKRVRKAKKFQARKPRRPGQFHGTGRYWGRVTRLPRDHSA